MTLVIALALYLTYLLGVFMALPLAWLLSAPIALGMRSRVLAVLGPTVAGAGAFWLALDLMAMNPFVERLQHVASLDLLDTSRGYIYENLQIALDNFWFGGGIGQFRCTLAALIGSDYPVSALNLLLSFFGSTGVIGLAISSLWLIAPNLLVAMRRRRIDRRDAMLLAPLNVFIVLYLTTLEELHIWHAVTLGLLLGVLSRARRSRRRRRSPVVSPTPAMAT